MKILKVPPTSPVPRQMSFLIGSMRLKGLSATDRSKVALVLAQILMQAAGLIVEELDDDGR